MKEDIFMPKNKFQDVIFTIIMVFVMVYTMICYNIALNVGGMNNQVFFNAFHELVIMGPIAFILDFFLIGPFAKKKAFSIVNLERDNAFHLVIAISVVSVIGMCPLMSFAATLLFKKCRNPVRIRLVQTTAINFPMAFFWQLCFAGPLVRKIFGLLFPEEETRLADGQEA